METLISLVIIMLIIIVIAWWRNSEEEKEINKKRRAENDSTIKQDTALKISFAALQAIGCQPIIEDNSISVSYQGENFQFECSGLYARIWDPSWSHIKADDKDLSKVREAVNAANYNFGPTIVLSNPDNEGDILFHSKRDIMLHPSLPDTPEYIKSVLDSFFPIKENVREQYRQIEDMQRIKTQKRRPIGFASIQETNRMEK